VDQSTAEVYSYLEPGTNPIVVLITYANKIKLDQDVTLDKLEVIIYTQCGNPQKKKEPTMKDLHLPAVSMGISKLIQY
jgi:hypothetical protein